MPTISLHREMPRKWSDNMTLGECKEKFGDFDLADFVRDAVETEAKRYTYDFKVRFVRTSDETDLPDTLLLIEFRTLAERELAKLIVEEGGWPAKVLPKELVF
jgi:hypothetical protein